MAELIALMYFLINKIVIPWLTLSWWKPQQIINKAFVVTNMRLKETSWGKYHHLHSAIQNEIIILMSLKIRHLAIKEINHTLPGIPLWLMSTVLCRQKRVYIICLWYVDWYMYISRRISINFNCSNILVKLKRECFLMCDLFWFLLILLIFHNMKYIHIHTHTNTNMHNKTQSNQKHKFWRSELFFERNRRNFSI